MSKPTIVVVSGPTFYGKSLHEIMAEEGYEFEIVQASIIPKPIIEPAIFKLSASPKANEPWYRQFDKKRKQ